MRRRVNRFALCSCVIVGSACSLLTDLDDLRGGYVDAAEASNVVTDSGDESLKIMDGANDVVVIDSSDANDLPDYGTPLFDEEFDGGTLDTDTRWFSAGDGEWLIEAGLGEQVNQQSYRAMLYAQNYFTLTDYRIVSRMHTYQPVSNDVAMDVCFRSPMNDAGADASTLPDTLHCDFDLLTFQLSLSSTSGNLAVSDVMLPTNFAFTNGTWFTLDALVKGTSATCNLYIDGIGLVTTVNYASVEATSGSFGIRTFNTSGEFAYIRVYAAN